MEIPTGVQIQYLRKYATGQGLVPFGVIAAKRDENGEVKFGISICSKHDQFVKKIGRAKAIGRLLGGKTINLEQLNKSEDWFWCFDYDSLIEYIDAVKENMIKHID